MTKLPETLRNSVLPIQVFDFFSGCGGSCRGFQDAGLKIVFAIDNDADSQETFRNNFPDACLFPHKVEDVKVQDMQDLIDQSANHPILFSVSAPCQPFTKQKTHKPTDDSRRQLLDEFQRFAEYYLPDFIFLENVPGLQKMNANEGPFARLLTTLADNGYYCRFDVIKAQDYGVPQKRRRLILIASRYGDILFPPKTHGPGTSNTVYSEVQAWIGDLPAIDPSMPLSFKRRITLPTVVLPP